MTENTQGAPEEQKQEAIELSAKVDAKGGITWHIPKDLRIAIYLLKHLDVTISKMHAAQIVEGMRREQNSMENIMKPQIVIPKGVI